MSWIRYSLAVLLTAIALLMVVFGAGAFVVGNVFASGLPMAAAFGGVGQGGWQGWHGGDHAGFTLPPELASLKDVPADQRFSHFKGVTVNLTDKDGKPVQITVTPGVASAVSATSITLNGNDGASHTYAVDNDTFKRGTPSNGDDVVVVTLNNGTTARALIDTKDGWANGQSGPPRPWGR
jgi:hypothetical protein